MCVSYFETPTNILCFVNVFINTLKKRVGRYDEIKFMQEILYVVLFHP